jgi:hypothetical protein
MADVKSERPLEPVVIPLAAIRFAPWNYKRQDTRMMTALDRQTERHKKNGHGSGQLETLLVRQVGKGKWEVVDGNHRLALYRRRKMKAAACIDLGEVSEDEAMRVSIELNMTRWKPHGERLARRVAAIVRHFGEADVKATCPMDSETLDALSNVLKQQFAMMNPHAHDGEAQVDVFKLYVPRKHGKAAVEAVKQAMTAAGFADAKVLAKSLDEWRKKA